MSIRYNGYLELPGNEESNILPVAGFGITERYNGGWSCVARISATSETPITVGQLFGLAINEEAMPGTPAVLHLALDEESDEESEEDDALIVRAWPSVVTSIDPAVASNGLSGYCDIHLVDPVSYLGSRPVWGAYRACSAGNAIGGVLSMAAGGGGRPTLDPVLAGLPSLHVVESFRDSLNELPYAIACGQPLGEWLGEALGTLGLRMELFGTANGRVSLMLTDAAPNGEPIPMYVLGSTSASNGAANGDGGSGNGADEPVVNEIGAGGLAIMSVDAFPAPIRRGGVLDDPTLGSFRRFGQLGAVGSVQSGSGLDLDEAAFRASLGLAAAQAQMLILRAATRQPGMRPGRITEFNATFYKISRWQVARARHELWGNVYENSLDLFPADSSWHPPTPPAKPPRIVSAIVDGGSDDYMFHQPIPRDRLGRIPVSMSFLPTPTGAEAIMLALADKNEDLRITLADFEPAQVDDYTNRKDFWEQEAERLRAGEYDDPFPGRGDDELNDEEKARRDDLGAKRAATLKYIAYQWAKARDDADKDRDGYVSDRDKAVSEELQAVLARSGGASGTREAMAGLPDGHIGGNVSGRVATGGGPGAAAVAARIRSALRRRPGTGRRLRPGRKRGRASQGSGRQARCRHGGRALAAAHPADGGRAHGGHPARLHTGAPPRRRLPDRRPRPVPRRDPRVPIPLQSADQREPGGEHRGARRRTCRVRVVRRGIPADRGTRSRGLGRVFTCGIGTAARRPGQAERSRRSSWRRSWFTPNAGVFDSFDTV